MKRFLIFLSLFTTLSALPASGFKTPAHEDFFREKASKGLELFESGENPKEALQLLQIALVIGADQYDESDYELMANIGTGIVFLRDSLTNESTNRILTQVFGVMTTNFSTSRYTFGEKPEFLPSLGEKSYFDEGSVLERYESCRSRCISLIKAGEMKEAEARLLTLYDILWNRLPDNDRKFDIANLLGIYYYNMRLPDRANAILRQNKIEMERNWELTPAYIATIAYLGYTDMLKDLEVKGMVELEVADALLRETGLKGTEVARDMVDVTNGRRGPRERIADFIEANDREFFFLTDSERISRWGSVRAEWEPLKTAAIVADKPDIDEVLLFIEYEKQILLRSITTMKRAVIAADDEKALQMADRLLELKMAMTDTRNFDMSDIEAEYERLQKALLHHSSLNGFDGHIFQPVTAAGLADALRDNETFIDFGQVTVGGERRFCAVVITEDRPEGFFTLLCPVDDLRKHIRDTDREDTREMVEARYGGDFLYTALWQPLFESGMIRKNIIYSPAGELNAVMPEAILRKGKCMGEDYNFHILTAAGNIEGLRRGESYRPSNIVAFGAMEYYGDRFSLIEDARKYGADRPVQKHPFERDLECFLPHTDKRIVPVTRREDFVWMEALCRNNDVDLRLLTGIEASEHAFKALSKTFSGAVNISSHAFCFPEYVYMLDKWYLMAQGSTSHSLNAFGRLNPLLRTGIMLSGAERAWFSSNVIEGIEDGIINGEELAALDLGGVQLITLLACETGKGDIDEYEGVMGLRRALKLSGCGSIISAAWNLDSAAALAYLKIFYKSLLDGRGISQSHNDARRELIKRYDHPYYWAVFQLID